MQARPRRIEDPTLPPGWDALYDEVSQLTYYWHRESNTTTYDRPGGAPPAAAAPVVQPDSRTAMSNGYHAQPSHAPAHANGGMNGTTHASDGAVLHGEAYRRAHDMQVQGSDVPDPMPTFEAAGFPPDMMSEIHRAGFKFPTPIQAQAWPIALQGRDLVAIAKTGSGKTCGFLLPGIMHIKATRKDPRAGPTVLVLAPTRELAVQIKQEADKFGHTSGIRNTCVYGGAPKGPQLRDLYSGVGIVIATPGRLNDYLESRQVNLHQVSYLVLDEADRMLDMGFEPQIQKIVASLPAQRQTLFFSATWPKEVKAIAAQFVVRATCYVFIGGVEEKLVANKAITQIIEIVEPYHKVNRTVDILRSKPPNTRIIVFTGTKRGADELVRIIGREFSAQAIHGDKKQNERDWVLQSFKDGRCSVLVATDVAARGLDIPHVAVVINYDFPQSGVEDYVHRIGRTGRAGATGEAYTLFTRDDAKFARELCRIMRDADQQVPQPLESMAASAPQGGGRNRYGRGGPSRSYSTPNFFGGGGGGGFRGGSSHAPHRGGSYPDFRAPAAAAAAPTSYGSSDPYSRAGYGGRDAGSAGGDRYSRDGFGRDSYRSSSKRSRSRSRSRSPRRSHRDRSPVYSRYSPRR